jgi:hypothetical protein
MSFKKSQVTKKLTLDSGQVIEIEPRPGSKPGGKPGRIVTVTGKFTLPKPGEKAAIKLLMNAEERQMLKDEL